MRTLRAGLVNADLTPFTQYRGRPNGRVNERLDERPMADEAQWLTYAALAEKLGVSPEAARQKAVRGRWRRQRGNDGRALVLVEPAVMDRLKAGKRPSREHPDGQVNERVNEHPNANAAVNALMEHVETLKAALARAEATVADRDADVRRERERVEELTRDLLRVTGEAMAAASARDDLRAELDAMRARPWWKRMLA